MAAGNTDVKRHEIRLSYNCNNNCRFCEVAKERKIHLEPTLHQVKAGLLADKDWETAEFFGGEPTISPYFLKVLGFVTEQGKKAKIDTNCRMFYYREFAKRVAKENVALVETSIESHRAETHDFLTRTKGSFRQTVQGIKNIREEGVQVNTTTVMMEQNIRELRETAGFIFDTLGIENMRFSFLQVSWNGLENMEVIPRLTEIREGLPCLVDYAKERGIRLSIDQGPMCVIGSGHPVFEVAEHTSKGNRKLEKLFTKPAKCEPCKMYGLCPGVCKGYAAIFGTQELNPMKRTGGKEEAIY